MYNIKKTVSLLLIAGAVLAVTACSNNNTNNGNSDLINQEGVIATVNGKAITQSEYDETLAAYKKMVEAQYGEGSWDKEISEGQTLGQYYEKGAIIDNMILEHVIVDAADKEGITITDEDLGKELETYKQNFKDDNEYKEFLENNGMTEDYLKEAIRKEYIINHYLSAKLDNLNPTDEELKKLFDDYKMGEKIRASHILVKTEEEAKTVEDRLNKGEKFEDLAKELSIDPSGANGGDLDFFSYTDMVEPFSKAAFSMNVGDVSDPVETQYGYHIIKVTDKKTDDTVTFDSVKDKLNDYYKSKKYQELIDNLKKEANIEKK